MDNEKENKLARLSETKEKIMGVIRLRGPSLPVHVARETGLSMLLASAILSELLSEKAIKISNLKVGGSPLYFLPGQEYLLEKFYTYLPAKEREAFMLLKQNNILQDSKLEPAIRVALRSIKDFSFPIVIKQDNREIIFWRFFAFPREEAMKEIESIFKAREEKKEEREKEERKEEKRKDMEVREKKKQKKKGKESSLLEIKKPVRKGKERSGFVLNVIKFLNELGIGIVKELDFKKREFSAIIRKDLRFGLDLGKTNLFLIAKDKKRVSENDLAIALQKAQSMKMFALFLSTGELSRKARKYLETWENIIRFKKLKF